jgi:dihydropteroate synthase
VGISRKSMLGVVTGLPAEQRLNAGLAATAIAVWQGAAIVRSHDVRAAVEVLKLVTAARRHQYA